MSWSATAIGLTAGISTAIGGITGPATDAAQITAVKTLLLSELSGICAALYNGARLTCSGDVQTSIRTVQICFTPLSLVTA